MNKNFAKHQIEACKQSALLAQKAIDTPFIESEGMVKDFVANIDIYAQEATPSGNTALKGVDYSEVQKPFLVIDKFTAEKTAQKLPAYLGEAYNSIGDTNVKKAYWVAKSAYATDLVKRNKSNPLVEKAIDTNSLDKATIVITSSRTRAINRTWELIYDTPPAEAMVQIMRKRMEEGGLLLAETPLGDDVPTSDFINLDAQNSIIVKKAGKAFRFNRIQGLLAQANGNYSVMQLINEMYANGLYAKERTVENKCFHLLTKHGGAAYEYEAQEPDRLIVPEAGANASVMDTLMVQAAEFIWNMQQGANKLEDNLKANGRDYVAGTEPIYVFYHPRNAQLKAVIQKAIELQGADIPQYKGLFLDTHNFVPVPLGGGHDEPIPSCGAWIPLMDSNNVVQFNSKSKLEKRKAYCAGAGYWLAVAGAGVQADSVGLVMEQEKSVKSDSTTYALNHYGFTHIDNFAKLYVKNAIWRKPAQP
jgi:hypothetical protein